MKLLSALAIIFGLWLCAPAHAQFNGCSSFCGTSSSSVVDGPGFNNRQGSGGGSTLACTYTPVTTGTQNVAYTGATPSASGGVPAYTFSETGALPTGLSINTSTGVISGTPTVAGSFPSIQVKVADTVPTNVNCGASFTLVIAFVGPGDINGAAYAWYGLRGFSAAYAAPGTNPAVDLVDQAGANPITINILSNGKLDVASISTWVTAHTVTTIKISRLYDQSGNLRHVSNATLANMPVLTLSGLGSLPVMTATLNTSNLQTAAAANIAQPFTVSVVAEAAVSADGTFAFDDNDGNKVQSFGGSWIISSGANVSSTAANGSPHALQGLFNNTTSSGYLDGSLTSGSVGSALAFNGKINLFSQATAGSNGFGGFLCEFGFWASDKTANNSSMNSNQHTFWGF